MRQEDTSEELKVEDSTKIEHRHMALVVEGKMQLLGPGTWACMTELPPEEVHILLHRAADIVAAEDSVTELRHRKLELLGRKLELLGRKLKLLVHSSLPLPKLPLQVSEREIACQ